MKVEIKVLPDNDDKVQPATIEMHSRRGDGFNIDRNDTVAGDVKQFTIPDGGRLVLNAPNANEQPVFDAAQGASIYPSQQASEARSADAPKVPPVHGTVSSVPKDANPAAQSGATPSAHPVMSAAPADAKNSEQDSGKVAPTGGPSSANTSTPGSQPTPSSTPAASKPVTPASTSTEKK